MLHIITLGRDYYSKQHTMYDWCRATFGDSTLFSETGKWSVSEAFGQQTFTFKEEKDAILFSLRWENTK